MRFRDWVFNRFGECGEVVQLDEDMTTLENVRLLVNELFDDDVREELLFQVKLALDSIENKEVDLK